MCRLIDSGDWLLQNSELHAHVSFKRILPNFVRKTQLICGVFILGLGSLRSVSTFTIGIKNLRVVSFDTQLSQRITITGRARESSASIERSDHYQKPPSGIVCRPCIMSFHAEVSIATLAYLTTRFGTNSPRPASLSLATTIMR
jgi:hypothetical protein